MSDGGISAEDIAKIMLIQSALAEKGVSPDMMIEAILSLIDEDDYRKASQSALAALRMGSISQEELMRMLTASKALAGGKIRGWKEIGKILQDADLTTPEGIAAALKKAIKAGCLDKFALAKAALMSKALAATGASPESVAKAFRLQRELAESGMAVHDIANAMSLTMSMTAGKSRT